METKYPAHEKYGVGRAIMCNEHTIAQIPIEDMLAMSNEFTTLKEKADLVDVLLDLLGQAGYELKYFATHFRVNNPTLPMNSTENLVERIYEALAKANKLINGE